MDAQPATASPAPSDTAPADTTAVYLLPADGRAGADDHAALTRADLARR